ncbi:hypothetical protein LRP88_14748 [Fusarium phalaenopsidis]
MSVLVTTVSKYVQDNPVRKGDVERLLSKINVKIQSEDSDDFCSLLAAIHDCATDILSQPDYQPLPDLHRFPREDVRRTPPEHNVFGHAWAHQFMIRGSQGTLKGKSVCLKDNIAVAGVPMLFGTSAIPPWTPTTDAVCVTRALEQGADIVGTTICENFCHSTSSYTSGQGIVHNPRAGGYSAGGSTSGAAALVAGGLVDMAIGADQGGSIRVPAALCGCVGFKPTHGMVPYTGILSGDAISDHAGPMTQTVQDAALLMDAISGYDGIDDRSLGASPPGQYAFADSLRGLLRIPRPFEGYKIGLIIESLEHSLLEPAVKAIVLEAATRFEILGAKVHRVSIPEHLEGHKLWSIQQRIASCNNILGHQHGRHGLYLDEFDSGRLPWTQNAFGNLFPSTQNVIINGLYLNEKFPGLYGKTMNLIRKLRDRYESALREFDVLITPTTPKVAPKHGKQGRPLESLEPSIGMTINTCGFNVTGHPALAIPVGLVPPPVVDGGVHLPVSMQIVGPLKGDEMVLKVGHAWESRFKWQHTVYAEQVKLL